MTQNKTVRVIGAGLAGVEATWQLVKRGIPVELVEMRPVKSSPAHKTADFAELVCSNSLRSDQLTNAVGVLKAELRLLDSLVMKVADEVRVPAGSALAVDRDRFSQSLTQIIKTHPLVTVINAEVESLDPDQLTIIATGPLTSEPLARFLQATFNQDSLYFYDAAAPIVEKDSIDFTKAYYKSRYDKGDSSDYINCPMTKPEFEAFYQALIHAETVKLHEFEKEIFFEGCMPFEEMARRGEQTLLFGPMKPVGLRHEGNHPYAVVQLRQDNAAATLYNIVGFQTHLTWPEQRRILRMIPGLENAEFARYGVMHRNTYLKSPLILNTFYRCKSNPNWYFAGQMTGVEGYVESAASGCVAGINMAHQILGLDPVIFEDTCVIGSMAHYVSRAEAETFQPMNANFGLLNFPLLGKKHDRKERMARQAIDSLTQTLEKYEL